MEQKTILWVVVGLLLLACGSLIWLLNRGYGETSEQGYAYSMALVTACNQRDVDKLNLIADMIEADLESGKLNPTESRWLMEIIEKGHRGDWDAANRDVRRLMRDQLQPAP